MVPLNSLRGSHALDLPARVVQMSQSEGECHDTRLQSSEEGMRDQHGCSVMLPVAIEIKHELGCDIGHMHGDLLHLRHNLFHLRLFYV